jgi:hypothetical protein
MKKQTKSTGAAKSTVRSGVKAGGWANHSQTVKVRSGVRAGGWSNHAEAAAVRA